MANKMKTQSPSEAEGDEENKSVGHSPDLYADTADSEMDVPYVPAMPASDRISTGMGILLVLLGGFALISTYTSSVISVIFLGILMMIGGFSLMFNLGRISKTESGRGWKIALAVILSLLYIIGGWYLIAQPTLGALTVTWVMSIFFIAAGLVRFFSAIFTRGPSWGWMATGAVVTFLLGLLLLNSWPVSGLYAIGLFVGLDLIIIGITAIASGGNREEEEAV